MGKHWTKEEDNILLQYYPIEGIKVAERLPGREARLCISRAKSLGMCNHQWTAEEDNIIKIYYPDEGANVQKRLPNRTVRSCQSRARFIGIPSSNQTYLKKWTAEEDELLKSVYPLKDPKILDNLFERHTKQACLTRACLLGLAKKGRSVMCIETGKIYNTITEAAKDINIPADGICHACGNSSKTHYYKGYHWQYTDIE